MRLPSANRWTGITPPGKAPSEGRRRLRGATGPGIGYALTLTRYHWAKVTLGEDEEPEDVIEGFGVLIGKRSSLLGRSPIAYDVDFFVKLFGFDGTADPSLIEFRRLFFRGAAHSYLVQRQIADAVPDSTSKMSLAALSETRSRQELFSL